MVNGYAADSPAQRTDHFYDGFVATPVWMLLGAATLLGAMVTGAVLLIGRTGAAVAEEAGLAVAALTLLSGLTDLPEWLRARRGGKVPNTARELAEVRSAQLVHLVGQAFSGRGWTVDLLRSAADDDRAHARVQLLARRSSEVLAVHCCPAGHEVVADDLEQVAGEARLYGAHRSVVVATAACTDAARTLGRERCVDVIDGDQLLRLLPARRPRRRRAVAVVRCPECAGPMRAQTSRFGHFWACAGGNGCRGTQPVDYAAG